MFCHNTLSALCVTHQMHESGTLSRKVVWKQQHKKLLESCFTFWNDLHSLWSARKPENIMPNWWKWLHSHKCFIL